MAQLTRRRKVCVIGAGAAGLCAIRHLARDLNFEVSAYEQTNKIGGTWVYNEKTDHDENGLPIHSSMYRNLRTNLPAKIMNFPDYMTMNAQVPCCVSHQEVLAYLKDYAEHFDLLKHIQFDTMVKRVRFCEREVDGGERWTVRTKCLKTNVEEDIDFDAIMICNGHYFDPYMPVIPGLETFRGTILHSHSYRKPEEFAGKSVFVLGAASSGIDIGIDLADHATQVYLSHNNDRFKSNLPSNVFETIGLERIEGNEFILKDQTHVTADVFLYCTGYRYSFPFLDENCGIRVDDNYVTPLYKHMINIEHPTMCIIGIPTTVVPFPMFHIQVQYFMALLKGTASLPSKEIMLEDSKLKVAKKRHAHKMSSEQWRYNDTLAAAGNFERLPSFYKNGYEAWGRQRLSNLLRYKYSKFVVLEDGEHVEITLPN